EPAGPRDGSLQRCGRDVHRLAGAAAAPCVPLSGTAERIRRPAATLAPGSGDYGRRTGGRVGETAVRRPGRLRPAPPPRSSPPPPSTRPRQETAATGAGGGPRARAPG